MKSESSTFGFEEVASESANVSASGLDGSFILMILDKGLRELSQICKTSVVLFPPFSIAVILFSVLGKLESVPADLGLKADHQSASQSRRM